MIETILIARERKSGKDVLLAGREVPFREQVEAYKKLAGTTSEDYENVILAQAVPHKKPLKFITNDEAAARAKAHEAAVAAAEAAAQKSAKAKKKSSAKKPAEQTETTTTETTQ